MAIGCWQQGYFYSVIFTNDGSLRSQFSNIYKCRSENKLDSSLTSFSGRSIIGFPIMALQRSVSQMTSSSIFKLASYTACKHVQPSPSIARQFTSSTSTRFSSKRKLVTASAYHPQTLDSAEPPPRNSGVPETSIAGGIPQCNDIRPPQVPHQYQNLPPTKPDEQSASVPEKEAQKSKPTTETATSAAITPETAKPKRSKLRPRKAAMVLTPTAISHIRDLLALPEPKLIRVGVKNRGCSGLAYHLEYVEKPGAFDETVEQDGVKVLIDSKALFSIIGSEMDWVEDKLNERFVFRNPNISKCS